MKTKNAEHERIISNDTIPIVENWPNKRLIKKIERNRNMPRDDANPSMPSIKLYAFKNQRIKNHDERNIKNFGRFIISICGTP